MSDIINLAESLSAKIITIGVYDRRMPSCLFTVRSVKEGSVLALTDFICRRIGTMEVFTFVLTCITCVCKVIDTVVSLITANKKN